MRSVRENPEAYERSELWWQAYESDVDWIARPWESEAARIVPVNRRSVTGRSPSVKMRRMVSFESTLERDLFDRLEFDFAVVSYQEQPCSISYRSRGYDIAYIPDALVTFASSEQRKPAIIEVKWSEDLAKNGHEYEARFRAAKDYAGEKGLEFMVQTEKEIRTPFLRNAKLLLPYRRIRIDKRLSYDVVNEAARVAHTVGSLLVYVRLKADGYAAEAVILNLLSRGCLTTNFQRIVDNGSSIGRGREDP